jgi:acetyl esterase/lipase
VTREVLRDLDFAEYPGFRPVSLDLHRPDGAGPHPVVLQLHGGGWRVGRRGQFSPLVSEEESFGRIVAAGFAVVAADYRLSGEAVFPAQVDDVSRALAWIGEHADEYELDADRVVLWGGSAGGTLAALVGLTAPAGVRGVIDWYGPSDLTAMAHFSATKDEPVPTREDLWLGSSVLDVPDLAAAASPVHRVQPGAPPFHLTHGAADDLVPPAQTEALAAALEAAGVPVELHLEPGIGHFWRGASAETSAALFDRAIDFARRVTAQNTSALP